MVSIPVRGDSPLRPYRVVCRALCTHAVVSIPVRGSSPLRLVFTANGIHYFYAFQSP